uniref:Putative cell growth-regulating nucleolar protein n=1 Tax=Panstrongylus megistus TaxID=65343 RepID=A0A069DV51_9HEMI
MVVFTCQKCNSTLKKNAVEKHNSCRPFLLTCIDCLKDFRGKEYDEHKSCITEREKYGGSNVVIKPQGVKQEKWAEIASETLAKISHNNKYRKICLALKSSTNIPRNNKKFHNFVKNICPRLYETDIINEIFDHLTDAKNNKQETVEEKEINNKESTLDSNGTCEEIETINLDESISRDTNIKKKKKKKKERSSNETQLENIENMEVCENIKSESEQQTVLRNESDIKKCVNVRKLRKKVLNKIKGDQKMTLKTWFNIEDNENADQQNKENEENEAVGEIDQKKSYEEQVYNHSVAEPNPNNADANGKLSKKELKKLKKQKKYKAEIAEIENYQAENENTGIAQEEQPRKKNKKLNNTEEKVEVVCSTSPKRKLSDDEPFEVVEDIGGKRIKLNGTLVEEETPNETRKKFKWGKVIKRILENSSDKEMSLKKLRKKVISEYTVNGGGNGVPYEQLLGIFNKKVNSTVGIKVIKDRAQLIVD